MTNENNTRSVDIPLSVAERIEPRVSKTEFSSVDEYVSYVLEEVLYEIEEDDAESTSPSVKEGEEEEVKDRLRSLGYINE